MYKAAGLSDRFELDPQMRMPHKPRFSEDYLLIPMDEAGLLVVGGEKPELFRGKAARILLPRLLPLLDGTRTCEDIQAVLPQVKLSVIRDAVSLLFFRGLLEEGETAEDSAHFPPAERDYYQKQLQFFGRYTDVSRMSHNRYGTQQRLKATRLLLVADGSAGVVIAEGLAQAGIGQLTILPGDHIEVQAYADVAAINPWCIVRVLDPATPLEQALADQTFVLVVSAHEQRERWLALAALCRQHEISWLRTISNSQGVLLGPLFSPLDGACYQCFLDFLPPLDDPDQPVSDLTQAINAQYVQLTVVMELSRLFSTALINRVRSFTPRDGTLREQQVLRLPRCPLCGTGDNTSAPLRLPDDLAQLYHLETNHRWDGAALKGHQLHYSAQVSSLTMGAYKEYWSLPKLALPALESLPPLRIDLGELLAGTQVQAPERLTSAHLSQICGLSARWRVLGTGPVRFIPSGGGLCSSDMYALIWDVDGVQPGVYHYDGSTHRLECIDQRDSRMSLKTALAADHLLQQAGFAIVQTSHFYRLSSKYGPRGYRYTHLDAGVMTQSVRLITQALGLRAWNFGHFADDVLSEMLRLPPLQEMPAHVILVGC